MGVNSGGGGRGGAGARGGAAGGPTPERSAAGARQQVLYHLDRIGISSGILTSTTGSNTHTGPYHTIDVQRGRSGSRASRRVDLTRAASRLAAAGHDIGQRTPDRFQIRIPNANAGG